MNFTSAVAGGFAPLLKLIENGSIDTSALITQEIPLGAVNEELEKMIT